MYSLAIRSISPDPHSLEDSRLPLQMPPLPLLPGAQPSNCHTENGTQTHIGTTPGPPGDSGGCLGCEGLQMARQPPVTPAVPSPSTSCAPSRLRVLSCHQASVRCSRRGFGGARPPSEPHPREAHIRNISGAVPQSTLETVGAATARPDGSVGGQPSVTTVRLW